MPSISIGPLAFNSKAEAELHIRLILEEHRPASGVKKLSPEASRFARDLLDLHPHKEIVIGPGIDVFYCQMVEKNALRFLLRRTDGTVWDFSWRNCLNPPTPEKRLTAILRTEIQDQIEDFRNCLIFPLQCPVSGDTITRISCHIDHQEPDTFNALVTAWLRATGYSPDSIETLHKEQYGGRASIKDRTIAEQWRSYHRSNARLRAVLAYANLSTLRKSK